ncbi:hypothetical protein [Streptomyces sp. NBC_01803]|uniref:hypothetical protein n=1 Tax=Streptomyces sp. NBC_01803 TaxID=2975946 RepID=UPI002DDA805A|nr:hypothetical protein [Streptomyces sp. NBC_01803]WSA43705.1 hypothetical protein OIE51_05510 [Streptomyces sp. NBC_01803]
MKDTLTILACNFEGNGRGDLAVQAEMYRRLRAEEPDILLRQELPGYAATGRESTHWFRSWEHLGGMVGWLGPGIGATAIYINPRTVHPARNWADEVERSIWQLPPTVLSLIPDGTHVPILVASVHYAYHNAAQRDLETGWLTRLPDKWAPVDGQHAQLPVLIGGDFNCELPGTGPLTRPRDIADRPHRVHRTILLPGGRRVMDTGPAATFAEIGLADAAHIAATNGDKEALAPTVAASPTHGPARRCDAIYLSDALAPAVADYTVIDMTGPGLSDHDTVTLRLHLPTLRRLLADWPTHHAAAAKTVAHRSGLRAS